MSPVFWQTIKQRKWFLVWWGVGLTGMVALNVAFYPTFRGQAGMQLDQSLSGLSDVAKAFISDSSSYSTPIGYLSSKVFYIIVPMMTSILAIALGSSLLAKEERDGTLELLLARPVSRTRILAAKATAGLAISTIVVLFATLITVVQTTALSMHISPLHILSAFFVAWLMGLCFGALAFMITTLGRTARFGSVGVAALLLGASYIFSSLAQVVTWLRWPAKMLPFYYYRPLELLSGAYAWRNILYMFGVIILLGLVSVRAFKRRDIGN